MWSGWRTRLLIGLPLAAAVLGYQFYQKGETATEVKAQMLEICAGEAACMAAVNEHSDACFDSHYKMQRRNTGLRMDEFVACVNERGGGDFFASVAAE